MDSSKTRKKTRIAVYLIGLRGNMILLGKRVNVDHMNGYWSLVAGHVYEGESASSAMKREAKEECNLDLKQEELEFVGAMHHKSPPFDYVNFIFKANLEGKFFQNKETEKCESLCFHSIHNLPKPIDPYIIEMIEKSLKGAWISEYAWDEPQGEVEDTT